MTNRSDIEDKIDEWHELYGPDEDSNIELHDFLGLSWEEYSVFVEHNLLPGEDMPYESFVDFRNRMSYLLKEMGRYTEDIGRYENVLKHIRNGIALSKTHFYEDELHPLILEDLLKDNDLETD